MVLIFTVLGARAAISFCILSLIPGDIVKMLDSTGLAQSFLHMLTSHHNGIKGHFLDIT